MLFNYHELPPLLCILLIWQCNQIHLLSLNITLVNKQTLAWQSINFIYRVIYNVPYLACMVSGTRVYIPFIRNMYRYLKSQCDKVQGNPRAWDNNVQHWQQVSICVYKIKVQLSMSSGRITILIKLFSYLSNVKYSFALVSYRGVILQWVKWVQIIILKVREKRKYFQK